MNVWNLQHPIMAALHTVRRGLGITLAPTYRVNIMEHGGNIPTVRFDVKERGRMHYQIADELYKVLPVGTHFVVYPHPETLAMGYTPAVRYAGIWDEALDAPKGWTPATYEGASKLYLGALRWERESLQREGKL